MKDPELLEKLDLTNILFKKHAIFLDYMSQYNECSLKDFAEKSRIQYSYLVRIVDYFEKRGIITKYQPKSIQDKRCLFISLTPIGKDLCNAISSVTHIMTHGTKLKEPHFGDYGKPGIILLNLKDVHSEINKKRKVEF